jgi:hypothetical protein
VRFWHDQSPIPSTLGVMAPYRVAQSHHAIAQREWRVVRGKTKSQAIEQLVPSSKPLPLLEWTAPDRHG